MQHTITSEFLADTANSIMKLAQSLGAEEVSVQISHSVSTELTQRAGIIEKSQQSNSLGVGIELLVDGRFSGHSASDIRLESLQPFIQRAIDATRYLEVDKNRMLPDISIMGSASADIQAYDSAIEHRTADQRSASLQELETTCLTLSADAPVRSITTHVWDSYENSQVCASNGFTAGWKRSGFGAGAEITMVDTNDRLPEAYDYRSTRYLEDVPSAHTLASSILEKGSSRLRSRNIPSAKLPILIENRVAGKLIGMILSAMQGNNIYENRSFLVGKRGQSMASSALQIESNPLVPRGLASKPFDNDGLPSTIMPLVQDGVLQCYFLNVYNARRLQDTPTTGSASNIIIPPTNTTPQYILESLPKVISVEGFLGGNSNTVTGDFSFGITGRYFENGKCVQSVSEMNISGNIFDILAKFETACSDVWTYSNYRLPSLLFTDVQCSGV